MAAESVGLYTDQYELTMLSAALADGAGQRRCSFEVFGRRLPDSRHGPVEPRSADTPDARPDLRVPTARAAP